MIYATVAIIIDGKLDSENIATTHAAIRLLCDAAIASGIAASSDVEVWVLAHDHEPATEDDCQCEGYLCDGGAYRTFTHEPALA